MRYTFHLEGSAYSRNKEAFKELLRRHGLRWKGTFDEPAWGSAAERVEATFRRDPQRDITLAAILRWIGRRETPLLRELQAWVLALGGHGEREAGAAGGPGKRELEFWDLLHKPDERYLRAEGRPARWIERDLEEWRRQRRAKARELGSDQGDQGAEETSRGS